MKTRVMKLMRVRAHPDAGGATLFFQADGRARRRRSLFFRCEAAPEFDGEEAWFLAERAPRTGPQRAPQKAPWPDWRIVRRVNADGSPYAARETGAADA